MTKATSAGHMRAEAQVNETVAVAVVADRAVGGNFGSQLGIFGPGDTFDRFALVLVVDEHLERLGCAYFATHERLVSSDDVAHLGVNTFQIFVGERAALWQFKVVVEAMFDRRANCKRGTWPQFQDRLGQHV